VIRRARRLGAMMKRPVPKLGVARAVPGFGFGIVAALTLGTAFAPLEAQAQNGNAVAPARGSSEEAATPAASGAAAASAASAPGRGKNLSSNILHNQ